jgi:putative oxidoreductase
MTSANTDDLGKLVLRLTVGLLMLFHGVSKLSHGVGAIEAMLAMRGLPTYIAWGVYIGEVVAPLLILAGTYTRLAGLVVAINMVIALALVHGGQFFMVAKTGGWQLELQAFYLLGGIAIMLLGAGRFSVSGTGGKWN